MCHKGTPGIPISATFIYLYDSYYVHIFSHYDPCYLLKHVRNQENIFYNTYLTELMFIRTLLTHGPFGRLSSCYSKIKWVLNNAVNIIKSSCISFKTFSSLLKKLCLETNFFHLDKKVLFFIATFDIPVGKQPTIYFDCACR